MKHRYDREEDTHQLNHKTSLNRRIQSLYSSWVKHRQMQKRRANCKQSTSILNQRQPSHNTLLHKCITFQEKHDLLERKYQTLHAENEKFLENYLSSKRIITTTPSLADTFNLFSPLVVPTRNKVYRCMTSQGLFYTQSLASYSSRNNTTAGVITRKKCLGIKSKTLPSITEKKRC